MPCPSAITHNKWKVFQWIAESLKHLDLTFSFKPFPQTAWRIRSARTHRMDPCQSRRAALDTGCVSADIQDCRGIFCWARFDLCSISNLCVSLLIIQMSGWPRSEPNLIEMWTGHHGAWMVGICAKTNNRLCSMLFWPIELFRLNELIHSSFFSEPPPTTPGQPGEEEEEENGQPGASSSSSNQPSGDNRPQTSASRSNSGSSNSNSNRDSGSNFRSPQGVRLVG